MQVNLTDKNLELQIEMVAISDGYVSFIGRFSTGEEAAVTLNASDLRTILQSITLHTPPENDQCAVS